jgi:hypothetical protein
MRKILKNVWWYARVPQWVVLPYVIDDDEYVDGLATSCDPNKATWKNEGTWLQNYFHTYIHLILIIIVSLTHLMLIFPLCLKRKSRNNVFFLAIR